MNRSEEIKNMVLANLLAQNQALAHQLDEILSSSFPAEKEKIIQDIFKCQPGQPISAEVQGSLMNTISADQLLETHYPEPVWAIPGLLPVGLSILAGAPKVGKSWLSLQLAMVVAAGSSFFGKNVEAGRALVLALEDPPRRLQARMKAMGWPKGLPVDFMPLGQFETQVGNILNGGAEKLARQIESKKYRFAVIDTFSRAVTGDQQDVEVMTRMLTPIQEMAHQINCAIVLLDHHRKANASEPDAIADILGSTAKGAMADTVWGLYRERGKAGAKLSITGRDVEEQTLQIEFDNMTHLWIFKGHSEDLTMTDRRQEILDALKELGKVQMMDLCKYLKQEKGNLHPRLQDLFNAGLIIREKVDTSVFYQLAQ